MRDGGMKNYLRKSTLKGLTADCVRRKIKIIKTVQPGTEQKNEVKDKWQELMICTSQNWCGLTFAGDFYVILYLMRPTAS
jgi:hypothetical protein